MEFRIGGVLVESGVLSRQQVDSILATQADTGEPFGIIAERTFDVPPGAIEDAWASQYASLTRTIDPRIEVYEERALDLVTRRQAWQFRVLPIRFDGNELMLATAQDHLRRALRFATNVVGVPVYIVMADENALTESLEEYYHFPAMHGRSADDPEMDRLLVKAIAAGGPAGLT